jgi:enoyl-[acyl-carrier protein] reductase I
VGILEGKKLLITGVLMDSSIAFHVAKVAQEEGAEVVLTSFGRTMKITQTISRRLPTAPPVVELDVTDEEHLDTLAERLKEHVDGLDGVLHSIGFAPQGAFEFMTGTWDDVAVAMRASAYSLKALAVAALPLMDNGGSIVGLTFDAKFAWPVYDWMGVAKAAFESTNRYLARDLGPRNVRANLVSAGPLRTTAAKSIPGSSGSRRSGESGRRSAGTSPTRSPRPRPAPSCCPTGSPPRPARSSTSTAACTSWGSEDGPLAAPLGSSPWNPSRSVRYASSTVRTCTSPVRRSRSRSLCPATSRSSAGMRSSSRNAAGSARPGPGSPTPRNGNGS